MKTQALLPLVTYPDPNSPAVAANAVAMARLLDSSLHAMAINADLPVVSNAVSRLLLDVPEMVRRAEAMSREAGSKLLKAVEREAKDHGVEATTQAIKFNAAFLADTAADHGRYYDYVLCGWEADNPTSRSTVEAVVFGSGRPTILLPDFVPVGSVDHVALAWDGSRVAARAVGDAAPFLRRAAKVSVLTVVDEKPLRDRDAADRMAQALAKRGLEAEAMTIQAENCPIAVTLQERAIACGAGILVMGAFGHSRVRDFVLGGATESVLSDLRLPLLLSH